MSRPARACSTWPAVRAMSPRRPRRSAASAVGVDFSSEMVRLAAARYPGIRFQEGDAESLAFPDASFDAVRSISACCTWRRPDVALAEARRVLVRRRPLRADGVGEARGVGRVRYRAARYRDAWTHGRAAAGGAAVFPVQRSRRSGAQPASRPDSCARTSNRSRSSGDLDSVDGLYDAFVEGAVRTAALLKAQTPGGAQPRFAAPIADGVETLPARGVLSSSRWPLSCRLRHPVTLTASRKTAGTDLLRPMTAEEKAR